MKLKPFQNYLKQENISLAFLTSNDSNLTYFTQMKPSFAYLTITPKSASFYLTKLDAPPKLNGISIEIIKKGWEKNFSSKIKTIGINKEWLTIAFLDKLKKIFPRAKFIDISKSLEKLRTQKTPLEIKKITKACQITSNAFDSLINQFSKNRLQTEQDVALFLEKEIRSNNAELAFPTIVAMGKNSSIPHHKTSKQKLRKGFLLLDFGSCYQNYCSDMTRVIFLGTPSNADKKVYNLLLNTQKNTINQISMHKSLSKLDSFARNCLGNYSHYFTHSLGHGVGIDIHEHPSLSAGSKHNVQQNQIFTIEPGIYFPDKFGLRIEDTLHFSKKYKVLTTASKELLKLRI